MHVSAIRSASVETAEMRCSSTIYLRNFSGLQAATNVNCESEMSFLGKESSAALQHPIVLIFQPTKAHGTGGWNMLQEEVLDNVEAMLGIHLGFPYPTGVVVLKVGDFLAGCGHSKIKISGKGGLATIPQSSIDPVLATSSSVISLQNFASREADPLDSQMVSMSHIKGGNAYTFIPDSVIVGDTFRAFRKKSFYALKQRLQEVITGLAVVHRCMAALDFFDKDQPMIPPTGNDGEFTNMFVVPLLVLSYLTMIGIIFKC
ncbi:IAA-amino acid hydrolase ILR1-like 1 [Aristolochia californica]|uniref:IAA-amino acid hydrolase ILR1-like 1 n=1 Tax=Aristolochia californica TaxID=171875 RepID=UPI0035D9A522